jgi:hypothetical protein
MAAGRRRDKRQRTHPFGMLQREVERDPAAHAQPDHRGAPDAEVVEHREQVVLVVERRGRRRRQLYRGEGCRRAAASNNNTASSTTRTAPAMVLNDRYLTGVERKMPRI